MSKITLNERGRTYVGISFPGLLTIAFIILKLCKVINWSWVWVLSPWWISFVLGMLFIIGFAIYCRIVDRKNWRK